MQISGSNRINIEVLLKLTALLGFSLLFFTIIQSGKVQLYVHPRIVPYIKFSIAAMVLISLFTFRDLFKPKRKVNVVPYLFFIIPLLAAFTLPAKSMNSSSMAFGDIRINQQLQAANQGTAASDNTDMNTPGDSPFASTRSNTNADSLSSTGPASDAMDKALELQDNMVVVDDNNFVKWLQEIYDKLDTYEGKKIQVKGFVFKDKQFKENEFVPARLMMTCCSADLQPVGFLCRYGKTAELKHDTWVKVEGTIKVIDYKGQKTPIIAADSIVPADKPKNEYVYPY